MREIHLTCRDARLVRPHQWGFFRKHPIVTCASASMGISLKYPIVTSYVSRTHEPCTAVPKIFANYLVFTKISTTYKEKSLRRILEWSFVQISYKLSFCHNMPQIPYVFTQLSLFIRDGIKRLIFLWDSSARTVRPYMPSEFPHANETHSSRQLKICHI